jgi:carboxypeptidase family protein/photosynthesis system II assembly factor YCF48-like protein/putative zinc finger protein
MDPVKKLVAASLKSQVAGQPHPDAEVLSAFAENALSPKVREDVLEHLSACAACREVLFLSLPHDSETQKVLAIPKSRPRFAIRWAALALPMVIVAAVLVGRHEYTQTSPEAQKVASRVGYVQPPTVAMNKVPAEVDAIREEQPARKTAAAAPKALPEAKHITAQPSVTLDFKDSGQVVVEPATPRSDLKAESRNKNLPLMGRDAGELVAVPSANAPAPVQNVVGQAVANQRAYSYSSANAFDFAKQAAVGGNLAGTVVDPSGATVPNVKVTTVGPAGTKTVTSDADGKFSFNQLTPGQYSLQAAAPGFRTTELTQLAVLAGKPSDLRVKLAVGATSETVEVTAGAPFVSTDRGVAGKLDADKNVNAAVATTAESEVIANEKSERAQVSRKKVAAAQQSAAQQSVIGGPAGVVAGAGFGLRAPVFQWTLSAEGAVQRSLDGGKTWQSLSVDPTVADRTTFRTLSAVGRDIWVGGKSGSLYHSPDSGQHWTRIVPQTNGERLSADITRVDFSDLQNGTVSTSNGQTWTTADSGQTWQRK